MIHFGNTKRMKGFSLANREGCAPGRVKSARDRQELEITIVGTCCHAYGDKESRPLLICYLRKCHFWSLCILQLIPLNDKGFSVLPSLRSLLPFKKRKNTSCFSDIWVSENKLFWVIGLIIHLRWGEQP